MEDDEAGIGADLIDEMCRPEYADALLATEGAHMIEEELAAFDVEPDRGLVE